MNGLLIVGETNPYGRGDMALYHLPRRASGNLLRLHLGLRDHTYAKIAKANLCEGPWSKERARETATKILSFPGYRCVVMLGANVKAAFGVPRMEAFTAQGILVALPHPSGLNHQWHHPRARAEARALLGRMAPWIPWGEIE